MTMNQVLKLAATTGLALSLAAGSLAKLQLSKGEPEPGDDKGGKGNPRATLSAREAQPGDDRGGRGKRA